MNELSRYFAHHPLENPANYLGTDFDPAGAAAYRLRLQTWQENYRERLHTVQERQPPGAASPGQRHGPMRATTPPHSRYSFNLL
jgi:hypothetical protein